MNLAVGHRAQGRWPEAEALYEENVELFERVYGPEHTQTLHNASNLAHIYVQRGRYGEAEALHRQVLETRRRVLGPEHPEALASLNNLADALLPLGKLEEAETLYRKSWEAKERVLGGEHADTLITRHGLGRLLKLISAVNGGGGCGNGVIVCNGAVFSEFQANPDHTEAVASASGLPRQQMYSEQKKDPWELRRAPIFRKHN